jgi:arylsulfatase A
MNRIPLLLASLGILAGAPPAGSGPAGPGQASAGKPNIILIMADDLGAEGLGCYGSTSYKTPHLDALAKSGIRFTNGFSTPLCSPSRVELMTGRYGFRTGWTQLINAGADDYFDPKKEKTFGHVLKAAGYATGIAGKWQLAQFQKHPDHVRECGFDESLMWTWQMDGKRTDRYWNPSIWKGGKLLEGTQDKYGPDLEADFVCDFIRRHKAGPFFFYYPMTLVHNPFEPPPDSKEAKKPGKKGDGGARVLADMIAYMDKVVGRIVSTLDELKIRENTVVFFTGDNGTTRGIPSQLGARTVIGGKGSMADTGSRVPLLASWPGTAPAGKVLDDLVNFCDFLPTLGDLAGARLPEGVTIDGRSFAPQLRGEAGKPRDWAFTQLGKNRWVRDLRWKLHSDGRLFDIQNDPEESKPLAAGTEPSEAAAARKRLEDILAKLK